MPSIQVSGLTKRFGESIAVAGIDFSVPDGCFTTLLGPSGCGKTTTLRLLAGFERPDAGEISIGERVVASTRGRGLFVPPERRNVGVVFQSYALWPHMTAFDQIAYPLRARGRGSEVSERVRNALALVRLPDVGDRYPSQLSGGQQQRIALARALVFEPAVLLLDEPLSNLDAELRVEMRAELTRLHHEIGITTVYVTHDQSEALALSDQIVVMRLGHVVEQGSPAEIYEAPKSVYSAQFVGAANCIPGTVTAVTSGAATVRLDDRNLVRGSAQWLGPNDVGRAVVVVVKAEDVRISDGTGPATNIVAGRVKQSTFVGPHTELVVEVGAAVVHLRLPKRRPATSAAAVLLELPENAVRILPPDDFTAWGTDGPVRPAEITGVGPQVAATTEGGAA